MVWLALRLGFLIPSSQATRVLALPATDWPGPQISLNSSHQAYSMVWLAVRLVYLIPPSQGTRVQALPAADWPGPQLNLNSSHQAYSMQWLDLWFDFLIHQAMPQGAWPSLQQIGQVPKLI